MKLPKERLDIDLEVDPRPLTPEDKKAISEFIKADKQKRKGAKKRRAAKKGTARPHGKRPRKHPFSEASLSPDR
jgi:hypothetical protein